jgi:WhiB family redox-sensing transcriptional regulator
MTAMIDFTGYEHLEPDVDTPWREVASCKDADPGIFFPTTYATNAEGKRWTEYSRAKEAKVICAACPVEAECLTYGLLTKQEFGIWGGLTPSERGVGTNKARYREIRAEKIRRLGLQRILKKFM